VATITEEHFIEDNIVEGKFDFKLLNERKGRMEIVHIHNESHPKPYVALQAIQPPVTKYRHGREGI